MIKAHRETLTPSLMDNIQLLVFGKPTKSGLHVCHLRGDL